MNMLEKIYKLTFWPMIVVGHGVLQYSFWSVLIYFWSNSTFSIDRYSRSASADGLFFLLLFAFFIIAVFAFIVASMLSVFIIGYLQIKKIERKNRVQNTFYYGGYFVGLLFTVVSILALILSMFLLW